MPRTLTPESFETITGYKKEAIENPDQFLAENRDLCWVSRRACLLIFLAWPPASGLADGDGAAGVDAEGDDVATMGSGLGRVVHVLGGVHSAPPWCWLMSCLGRGWILDPSYVQGIVRDLLGFGVCFWKGLSSMLRPCRRRDFQPKSCMAPLASSYFRHRFKV